MVEKMEGRMDIERGMTGEMGAAESKSSWEGEQTLPAPSPAWA